MRERPILFSAPMVRAILSGSKSQTRRVVKPQPERRNIEQIGNMLGFKKRQGDGFWLWPNARERILAECPYGAPGDQLWVRETWQAIDGNELALRIMTEPHPSRGWIEYAATVPEGHEPPPRWRPSIHMPRWASRITLEVTGVRVERLQDISEADALAEGVSAILDEMRRATPRCDFQALWQSINGPGSWDANPWVWIVEFKRIKP